MNIKIYTWKLNNAYKEPKSNYIQENRIIKL